VQTAHHNLFHLALFCQDVSQYTHFTNPRNPLQNRAFWGKSRRNKTMIKILFICHGNICRSTMAQSIFTHLVHRQHLDAVFEIDSAATSREEIGNPPHYGTKNKLYEEHIPLIPHRARQMTRDDYLYYDLLIGMDTANIRNMTRIAGGSDSQQKIFKMLSFADYGTNHKLTAARDVADPWYTGDFDATFDDVISGCRGLLEYIKEVYNL
jgi:protein-tyrosine phosphatase